MALQATASRSTFDLAKAGVQALDRRMARLAQRQRELAALPSDGKQARALAVELDAELAAIEEQKRILDRLRERAAAY